MEKKGVKKHHKLFDIYFVIQSISYRILVIDFKLSKFNVNTKITNLTGKKKFL